jgi:hypothetical protein
MSVSSNANHFKSPDEVKCKHCGATPRLAHKILDPKSGGTLRMYKCSCGEQMWVNLPV